MIHTSAETHTHTHTDRERERDRQRQTDRYAHTHTHTPRPILCLVFLRKGRNMTKNIECFTSKPNVHGTF